MKQAIFFPRFFVVATEVLNELLPVNEDEIIKAVEKLTPAIVNVSTVKLIRDTVFRTVPLSGMGSGIIIENDGYILTNNHVVAGAERIEVTFHDGRKFLGRIVGTDPNTDVAVIKVDTNEVPAADLGDSDSLRVGQIAIAIGNPFGLPGGPTVTVGVVSALNRHIEVGRNVYEDLIQTDAAINPGNSGGALADIRGNVIGMNTAIIPFANGIGLAIPVNVAKKIARELILHRMVVKPWIGVIGVDVTGEITRYYDLPVDRGFLVMRAVEGSPAERGGIEQGDIFVAFEDVILRSKEDLVREIAKRKIGDRVIIELIRERRRMRVALRLEEEKGKESFREFRGYLGEGEQSSYVINPDKEKADQALRSLLQNKVILGYPACPVFPITRVERLDKDMTCPCKRLGEYLSQRGQCPLGLYVRRDQVGS